jgi:hypothetical protein
LSLKTRCPEADATTVVHTSHLSDVRDDPAVEQFLLLSADDGPIGIAAYRCPDCGHVERHSSTIPGTCSMCPGLVELVSA